MTAGYWTKRSPYFLKPEHPTSSGPIPCIDLNPQTSESALNLYRLEMRVDLNANATRFIISWIQINTCQPSPLPHRIRMSDTSPANSQTRAIYSNEFV